MKFGGLRFAGLEWRNVVSSKIMWAVVAALAVIPLMYGALYLAAFQDPYQKLGDVPVAVVNLDEGAEVGGTWRCVGDETVETLEEADDGLQWHFVSAEEAQAGMEGRDYYMVCTIPADFTQAVASAQSDSPRAAELLVSYDRAENMLASQIGESVWKEVRTRVSDAVALECWETVFDEISASAEAVQEGADGAASLEEGIGSARDGGGRLADGLASASAGAGTLQEGVGTLSAGAAALRDGTGALLSGAGTLQKGADALSTGLAQVSDGAGGVASGALQVQEGARSLQSTGTGPLAAGVAALGQAAGALPDEAQVARLAVADGQMKDGFASVQAALGSAEGGSGLAGGLASLQASVGTADDAGAETLCGLANASAENVAEAQARLEAGDVAGASERLAQAQELAGAVRRAASGIAAGVSQAAAGAEEAAAGTASLSAAYQGVSSTVAPLVEGAPELAAAVGSLEEGARRVDEGAGLLASGAQAVSSGAARLDDAASSAAEGAGRLQAGAGSLASGADELDAGAARLEGGLGDASSGAESLTAGLEELVRGSLELTEGLATAQEGAGSLAGALQDGADEARSQTANAEGKAEVMKDPVALAGEDYTSVQDYGTGFAPYFMSLALWVGALVAGFVFMPLDRRLALGRRSPFTVAASAYLPQAALAFVQATLLMLVLQFGLRLQIDHVAAFYGMGYLTAFSFMAVMQLLGAAFGFPGKFVAIILLILQLTSAAGTFPIEQTPAFFQAVEPFLPMTYVVDGMRQIMAGVDLARAAKDAAAVFGFGAVSFCLTAFVAYRKRTVRMADLHPILDLG